LLILDAERQKQADYQQRVGPAWSNPHELIFTTPIGTPVDPDNYSKAVASSGAKAGVGRIGTHILRHSAGSFLFANGVPTKVIAEVLGHSATRITEEIYIHVQARATQHAADVMDRALWG